MMVEWHHPMNYFKRPELYLFPHFRGDQGARFDNWTEIGQPFPRLYSIRYMLNEMKCFKRRSIASDTFGKVINWNS